MAAFVQDYGVGEFEHISDPSGQVWRAFGVNAQPSYVFINDDGAMARQVGALDADTFNGVIRQLIRD